jgi:hypothetical protein
MHVTASILSTLEGQVGNGADEVSPTGGKGFSDWLNFRPTDRQRVGTEKFVR